MTNQFRRIKIDKRRAKQIRMNINLSGNRLDAEEKWENLLLNLTLDFTKINLAILQVRTF